MTSQQVRPDPNVNSINAYCLLPDIFKQKFTVKDGFIEPPEITRNGMELKSDLVNFPATG